MCVEGYKYAVSEDINLPGPTGSRLSDKILSLSIYYIIINIICFCFYCQLLAPFHDLLQLIVVTSPETGGI